MADKNNTNSKISSLIGRNVKINYITIPNEITREIGKVYSIENGFIIIELDNLKFKWIPIKSIVRIEEV